MNQEELNKILTEAKENLVRYNEMYSDPSLSFTREDGIREVVYLAATLIKVAKELNKSDLTNYEDLDKLDMVGLCVAHENLTERLDDLDATKKVIRDEIESRMTEDSEIHGDYSMSKVKRISWRAKPDEVRDLGAVKEAVDSAKLTKLYKTGAKLPVEPTFIEFVQIKKLEKTD